MHVAMAMVLDPSTMPDGYSFDTIKAFIRSRLHLVPLFHRRLVQVPFGLHHPVWVEDGDFDLDYHIRRIGAPAPGGRRELAALAAQIASTSLDRSKPLWELWVIEGLKHDRVGIVTKVHHSAIDGASGADILVHLFDLEPKATDTSEEIELPVERTPTDLELIAFAAQSRVRRAMNALPIAGRAARSVTRVVQGRRDPAKGVGAIPLTAPRTPWSAAVTPHRDVGFARVTLAELKQVKQAFGTTVNDVVLALVSGTLRRYHAEHDALPTDPLLAVCPVSVRGKAQARQPSANQVSAMFASLNTQIDDPGERLLAIAQSTKGAKEEFDAMGAATLMDLAEFTGPGLFNLAFRLYSSQNWASRHRPVHNVIISNVPGPSFPLYFAGAELVATYPMGPVMEGCGLNVTVFSYREAVDIGFMVCTELIPDVWSMADDVAFAIKELVAAAAGEKPR
jgi:WS/DGAT/MGAT family acyltransferase